MKIRLHEIELGASDVASSAKLFQSLFGLPANVQQENLTVFTAGVNGLDFNLSTHLPAGCAAISFITDDLLEIERRLKNEGVVYEGPAASHLGMTGIQFKSPDGYLVKVNTPGVDSPAWLKV